MNGSTHSSSQDYVPGNPALRKANSLGSVTRQMCQTRARELAAVAGRPLRQVWQADYLQAKRELTGETDPDLQDAILDSVPASQSDGKIPRGPHR
jgi:hypothetical protein